MKFALLARIPNFDPNCVAEMVDFAWAAPQASAESHRLVAAATALRELFLEMTPLKSYTLGRKTLRLRTGVVPLNLHTLGDRPNKGEIQAYVKAFVQQRIRHARAVRMVTAGEELLKRVGKDEVKGDFKRGDPDAKRGDADGSSTRSKSVTELALAAAARLRACKPINFADLGLEDYDTDDDMPALLDECVPALIAPATLIVAAVVLLRSRWCLSNWLHAGT